MQLNKIQRKCQNRELFIWNNMNNNNNTKHCWNLKNYGQIIAQSFMFILTKSTSNICLKFKCKK